MNTKCKDKKIMSIIWWLNVVILFLYAVDLFGFPNKLAIVWMGVVGIYYWRTQGLIKIDLSAILLLIGMVAHACIMKLYSPDYSITLLMSLCVIPVMFYLLGKQLVNSTGRGDYEKKAEILTMTLTLGMFIHAMLNFVSWLNGHNGKLWDDFWPDGLCTVATQHSFLAVTAGALLAYGIYYVTKKWYYSAVMIVVALAANVINIIYDNRMVLMISVCVFAMNVLIYLYLNRKKRKVWYFVGGAIAGLVLVLAFIYGMNIGNIRESQYIHNLIYRDGGIFNNVRFQIHKEAISQIPSHWKGGGTMVMAGFHSAHNYWLELANQTGVIPFVPMVMFAILSFINTVKLVLQKNVSVKMKYLLPSVFMAMFLYFDMEVGSTPRPDYILYLTFMAGVIYQVQHCAKEGKQE